MRATPDVLIDHMAGEVTTLCYLFKLTRTDNIVLTVTNLDESIEYPPNSGIIYEAKTGFSKTALNTTSALNVDTLEVTGFLNAIGLTEQDIASGLWDGCDVRVYRVNYEDLTMGDEKLFRGWIGNISIGRNEVTCEFRSLTQKLQSNIVQNVSENCPHDLFDSKCQVPETEGVWKFSGITVDSVISAQRSWVSSALTQSSGPAEVATAEPVIFSQSLPTTLRHFPIDASTVVIDVGVAGTMVLGVDYEIDALLGLINVLPGGLVSTTLLGTVSYSYFTAGFFTGGKVLWTSGANIGLSKEIKTFATGGMVLLQEPMPYVIATSDQFTIWKGCLKRYFDDCLDTLHNTDNFGGFPFLPGNDRMLRGPA